MISQEQARTTAAAALASMAERGITPTPMNFEVWFTYLSGEKPRLCERIDRLIERAEPFTSELLSRIHEDYFGTPAEIGRITGKTRELREIALDLVSRLSTNHGAMHDYRLVLDSAASVLNTALTSQGLRRAIDDLRTATNGASERVRALEQLFAASVLRINELNTELAQSEKDATCDPLTGLANRRAFESILLREIGRAHSEGTPLSLLLLDLDEFKSFNDLHGHVMGDKLLRLVSDLLQRHIKGRDTAARYGGEEFAVILVDAQLSDAKRVSEHLRATLSKSPLVNRATSRTLGTVTCSIGVAAYRAGEEPTALIDRADRALYEAKRTGRNRVVSEADGVPRAPVGALEPQATVA